MAQAGAAPRLFCRRQKLRLLLEVETAVLRRVSRLGIPAKQCHHVLHRKLPGGRLALDRHVGQLPLAVLEIDDSLFHGVLDDQLVDLDV